MEASTEREASLKPALVLASTAVVLYAVDQITKPLVVANLPFGESNDVIGDLVQLWHVRNTGAAFSLLPGASWLFLPVTSARSAWSSTSTARLRDRSPWIHVVLGGVLAGTLGNLTDRLRLGYVVDFVSVGIGDTRFPTFNVADSAVVVGHRRPGRLPDLRRPARARPRRPRRWLRRRPDGRGARAGRPRSTSRSAAVAGISRAHAQRLIGDGRALVDGARRALERPAHAAASVISVELCAPPDETLTAESIPLRVAYEDESMLIVDKPAGLVVHPSAGHSTGTLVNALLGRARDRGEPLGSIAGVGRPGIVHRLDKETSRPDRGRQDRRSPRRA